MWIERGTKKANFIQGLINLEHQVLILQGARQVGKTSFVLKSLEKLSDHPQIKVNLFYPSSFRLGGIDYYGRDFFGSSSTGEAFLKNIETELGGINHLKKPAIIFLDEADQHPLVLESIQTLASFSNNLKFIFTGSNLENIHVQNAATGRKKYFDLFPITFREFLHAHDNHKLIDYFDSVSWDKKLHSDFCHTQLTELFEVYLRLGGMPKLLDSYLDPKPGQQDISEIIRDLAITIEENVKTVLGETSKLYEYEDVLRKLAYLSMNTLKFTHLQVQHAGRKEAKKLVAKTVGARVAHKIRLYESGSDLSKYILFDTGLTHYLLHGANILKAKMSEKNRAILLETFIGNELIATLITRDDLYYWKSRNKAEVDYFLRSPIMVGIDAKTTRGESKSLNSLALFEPGVELLIKICQSHPRLHKEHTASLPNYSGQRKIPLLQIPHYLASRLFQMMEDI